MMRRSILLALAALALFVALALPNTVGAMGLKTFLRLPLELPAILAAMVALAGWRYLSFALRIVLSLAITVMVLLKLADAGTFQAFSRPFNPIIDMFMLPATMNLLTGTLGRPLAFAAAFGAVLAIGALAILMYWSLSRWSRPAMSKGVRGLAGALAVACTAYAVADAGRALGAWSIAANPVGSANTSSLAVSQAQRARAAAIKLADYRKVAARDPYADAAGLFDLLEGRDVLVIFVESYGRASFDNPLYRDTHVATLRAGESAIAEAGLTMRSGWLTSPISGGQSWLAHGTFASGLATGDNARYGAMLASPRQTLFHLAARAGYRTGAVMPAITLAWPEGPLMGFEKILAAADLNYAGQPFNWVTMPDQYTLGAYPALMGDDPRPDFLQIALISSHAPWVPVPQMIDWANVGDGRAFDIFATSGDTPKEVWRDRDRVRDQYRQAVDYALQATLSFVERGAGDDAPIVLVLGDHQPAPFVSQIESHDVPLHLIAPPEVITRIDKWGLSEGLVPGASAPVWPMAEFRDRFIAAFSSGIPAPDGS